MMKLLIISACHLFVAEHDLAHARRQVLHRRQLRRSASSASPLTTPGARSAPMVMRRCWLLRSIRVGPAPKPMSATTLQRHRAAGRGRHRQVLDRRQALARILVERRRGSGSGGRTARIGRCSGRCRRASRCGSPGSAPGWSRRDRRRGRAAAVITISGRCRSPLIARRDQLAAGAHLARPAGCAVCVEHCRIVAAEVDRDVAAAPPLLRAEGDARVGDPVEQRRERALELDAGPLALLLERDVDAWRCRRGRGERPIRPRAAGAAPPRPAATTAPVCASVVPGTISIVTVAAVLVDGRAGRSAAASTNMNDRQRPARRSRRRTVVQRCRSVQASSRHIARPSASLRHAWHGPWP